MDCSECRERTAVEVLNANRARSDKRKDIIIIILIAALVLLAAWHEWNWSQFDVVGEETRLITDEGDNNYIGNDGRILNGIDDYTP